MRPSNALIVHRRLKAGVAELARAEKNAVTLFAEGCGESCIGISATGPSTSTRKRTPMNERVAASAQKATDGAQRYGARPRAGKTPPASRESSSE